MLEVKIVCDFVRYCYILTLVLTCFHPTKGRATYFQPETIVVIFLHLMVGYLQKYNKHSILYYKITNIAPRNSV